MNPASTTDLRQSIASAPAASVHVQPALSIIIVNYRQWRNASLLLQQLLASDSIRSGMAEIIVVDNQAQPSIRRRRLRKTPGISVRVYKQNRGFAKGANEGWRLSRGDWAILLNPDTTVPPGFIETALAAIERWRQESRVGLVGCKLLDTNGAVQGSAGSEPTLWRLLCGLFKPRAQRKCRPILSDVPRAVPWVTGCGMLVRRECLEQLGGFDSRFFLYYEDVDLCRRARAAGWTVWHDPTVACRHLQPLHNRPVPAHLRLLTRHALLTYALRHWPKWQFRLLCRMTTADARVRMWNARRRGQFRAVRIYEQLLALINEFRTGKSDRAYRRAWKIAQQQGRRHERPRKPR